MAVTQVQAMEVAAAFAAATKAGDAQGVEALGEPGAVVWHNYDSTEVSLSESGKVLRWMHRTVTDLAWEDMAIQPTPTGFVWQAVVTGSVEGRRLAAPTCVIATIATSGLITRVEEYLDLATTSALRG